jgi:UDP-N-acetylglucosamine--N-acetylmuramyl-(pentapeptide) pyrophosphoryl-undecaprenol N-acetylglucosamine transferase
MILAVARSLLIVARTRPRVTIGTGGYVCVPACLASWLWRVPVVLFLPDVEPGKAVKALLPLVRRLAVTTEDSLAYVPHAKAVVTGYPLRLAFLHADRGRGRARFDIAPFDRVLCVFGGSLGARTVNTVVAAILPSLLRTAHVIHVCGRDRYAEVQEMTAYLSHDQRDRYHLVPYLDEEEMADALAACDLAVCRSGASVLGELPATATPAVLVPLPIAGVHQRANAEYLVHHGAAVMIDDESLGDQLSDVLELLLNDEGRLEQMAEASRSLARRDAADAIARIALEVAR